MNVSTIKKQIALTRKEEQLDYDRSEIPNYRLYTEKMVASGFEVVPNQTGIYLDPWLRFNWIGNESCDEVRDRASTILKSIYSKDFEIECYEI